MAEAAPSESLIGTVLGGFRLVEKVGEGGMGAVYKGYDESLDRHVAVKILPQRLAADETYVQRFMREARSVAKLHHPNLVHIYAVGEQEGLHYFAMEMIAGEPLSVLVARGGGLPIIDCVRILGQTMSALDKVHSLGIVHRDIKSANIMITPDERAILMDFGLAKGGEYAEGVTSAGIVLGTPEYMSPEQALGEEATAQSDVYSLGVLFFEMLTGRLPFVGKSAIAVIRQHAETDAPAPSSLREGLPAQLDEVVLRAMAKDRSVRYANLPQMAAGLLKVGRTRELVDLAGSAGGGETQAMPRAARKTMEQQPHPPAQGTAPTIVDSGGDAGAQETPAAAGVPTMAADLAGIEAAPGAPRADRESSATGALVAVAAGVAAIAVFLLALYYFYPGGEDGDGPAPAPVLDGTPALIRIGGGEPFPARYVTMKKAPDGCWLVVFVDAEGKVTEVAAEEVPEINFDIERASFPPQLLGDPPAPPEGDPSE